MNLKILVKNHWLKDETIKENTLTSLSGFLFLGVTSKRKRETTRRWQRQLFGNQGFMSHGSLRTAVCWWFFHLHGRPAQALGVNLLNREGKSLPGHRMLLSWFYQNRIFLLQISGFTKSVTNLCALTFRRCTWW
jgi:hypothetical protein